MPNSCGRQWNVEDFVNEAVEKFCNKIKLQFRAVQKKNIQMMEDERSERKKNAPAFQRNFMGVH